MEPQTAGAVVAATEHGLTQEWTTEVGNTRTAKIGWQAATTDSTGMEKKMVVHKQSHVARHISRRNSTATAGAALNATTAKEVVVEPQTAGAVAAALEHGLKQ